ncbi:hypothetical protein GCM10009624_17190 [Gordonia sinesedis]
MPGSERFGGSAGPLRPAMPLSAQVVPLVGGPACDDRDYDGGVMLVTLQSVSTKLRQWSAKGGYGHSLGVWVVLVGCVSLGPYFYLWLTLRADHTPRELQEAIFGHGGLFLTSIGLLAGSAKILAERAAVIPVGLILVSVTFCAIQYGAIITEPKMSDDRLSSVTVYSAWLVLISVVLGIVATVRDVTARRAEVKSRDPRP